MIKSLFALVAALSVTGGPVNAQVPPPASVLDGDADGDGARAIELPGSGAIPPMPKAPMTAPAHGDIAFNLPATDARIVARAVLGDTLHVPFAVESGVSAQVTAVTPYPIARAAVLPFLEEALRAAHLALVHQNGTYVVMPADQARGIAAPGDEAGFASDVVHLQYVTADEIKSLLDPILPGVVTSTLTNTLTLSGTSGQRAAARDIIAEFDVNWLHRMSFALYIPRHSDSRLIVPELDKVLNAPDAPTRSMVRLIAMEKLNGILAVTAQAQYLTDVRRWVEVLDREGENNEEQLFVYRVQNGRSKDLARTLNQAFGLGGGSMGDADRNGSGVGSAAAGSIGAGFGQAPAAPPVVPPPVAVPLPGAPRAPSAATAGDSSAGGAHRLAATISSDENNNAVVIYGTPHDYGIVLSALRKLDVAPIQVMIEAAITEVQLNNDTNFGVQWQAAGSNLNGILTQSTTAPDQTTVSSGNFAATAPGFSLLFTHGASIAGMLSALQTHTRINVVSAPKLMVLNNQTAALQVGDQVPVLTQSATSVVAGSAVISSVDYKDTGVILKITPRVNESGMVLLDISQEVSSVSPTTTSGISSPTISTRKIATSVAARDGEVIGLGGMIIRNNTVTKAGIPVLSQIPVIGALFSNQIRNHDRTELIVLIKPRVIRTPEDSRGVTDELRTMLKGAAEQSGTATAIP